MPIPARVARLCGWVALAMVWLGTLGLTARADVTLPAVLSDDLVLQRDQPLPIWGWAAPGEEVTVTLGEATATATAGKDGKWLVRLPKQAAGGPLELTVAGKNTLTLHRVLIGEVWLCSGQSNMEFSVGPESGFGGVLNAAAECAAADYPLLREFHVAKAAPGAPAKDCQGQWVTCTPQTAGRFSAVGYFFGRHLLQELKVPVGLIHSSWGGTPAEAWTSRAGLAAQPALQPLVEKLDAGLNPSVQPAYAAKLAAYEKEKNGTKQDDTGWELPGQVDAKWPVMGLPSEWHKAGLDCNGVVWFRRTVDIPAAWAGHDLALSLGPIDDNDVTYFNGTAVGHTDGWDRPRQYVVPAAQVQAGPALIAIRVTDTGGGGGLYGAPELLSLGLAAALPDAPAALPLTGPWKYGVAQAVPPAPPVPFGPGNSWWPSGLYNGMIAPLVPYGIRGAIWYQGESNAGRAYQYRTLLPAMIRDWRQAWGEGDFPFILVQLASFTAPPAAPGESDWAELREAQTLTLAQPQTGMAVALDIGDEKDIHPKNKQEVGRRLALWALANTYGQTTLVHSGPRYAGLKVEGAAVRLSFTQLGGGLRAQGGPLKQFAIAGADRKFVWAEAEIDGQTVRVSSAQVPQPVAVRYAWANNPAGANLTNAEGLPASPFRTDDWPGLTLNAK